MQNNTGLKSCKISETRQGGQEVMCVPLTMVRTGAESGTAGGHSGPDRTWKQKSIKKKEKKMRWQCMKEYKTRKLINKKLSWVEYSACQK